MSEKLSFKERFDAIMKLIEVEKERYNHTVLEHKKARKKLDATMLRLDKMMLKFESSKEEETSDKFSHILIEESGKPISGGIGELDSIPLPIIRLCESDSPLYINRGWNTNALSRCNECIMRVNK